MNKGGGDLITSRPFLGGGEMFVHRTSQRHLNTTEENVSESR